MIIGLHGQKSSGKDTVCDRARNMWEAFSPDQTQPIDRIAFGDWVKASLAIPLQVSPTLLDDYKNDPNMCIAVIRKFGASQFELASEPVPLRKAIQLKGTEAGRDLLGEDIWIDPALPRGYDHGNRIVFVTDVRFPSEASRVRQLGGIVVAIGPFKEGDDHSSEKRLPYEFIDFEIDNEVRDDGYESLDRQVRELSNFVRSIAPIVGTNNRLSVL